MTSTWIRSLAVCALVFAIATPASAQKSPSKEDKKTASARFQKGVELYKAGDVRAALIEFRRAYKLAPTYHLLFNIGQASAELRDYVEAHNSFTQYLRDGGKKIKADRREMVEREIARLKGYLARLTISVSVDGAEVTIDGVVIGISPLPAPLLVSAGRRQIVVGHQGHARWERSIDLAGEDEKSLEVELLSLATAPPPVARTTVLVDKELGGGFWAVAGLTAALGVGTGVAGFLTLRAKSDLDTARTTVPTTQAAIDDAADKTRRLALLTDVGIGLTAAGAIVTVILAIRGSGTMRVPAQEARRVDVVVGPESVAVTGRF